MSPAPFDAQSRAVQRALLEDGIRILHNIYIYIYSN